MGGVINRKKIPSSPHIYYKDQWDGWPKLDRLTYEEFLSIVPRHIKYISQFISWRKTIGGVINGKKIPSNPNVYYRDKWKGWPHVIPPLSFMPYEEFKKLIRANGIQSRFGYLDRRLDLDRKVSDWKLPSHPNVIYKKDWEGWPIVTGTKCQEVF